MRLRAATLMETLISMTLLATVLAIAALTFSNVVQSDRSARRTAARLTAEELLDRIDQERMITEGTANAPLGTATVEWSPLPADARRITIRIADNDDVLLMELTRTMPGPWRD